MTFTPVEDLKWQEYKCHKVVRAVKITEATFVEGSDDITIAPADASVPAFIVTRGWWGRYSAQAGGYCVLYRDGYMSWSPAKEFEDGYTKMDGGEAAITPVKQFEDVGPRFGTCINLRPNEAVTDVYGRPWWLAGDGKLTLCDIDKIPDTRNRGIGWAVKQMHGGNAVRRKAWPSEARSLTIIGGAPNGWAALHAADITAMDWLLA